jgi:TM2 domain-containing membrane protein YozV
MRNKELAIVLGFLGGFLGLHQFYLGRFARAFLHIILFYVFGWKFALFFGIISALKLLFMTDESFDLKFNKSYIRDLNRKNEMKNNQQYTREIPKPFQRKSTVNNNSKEYFELKKGAKEKISIYDFDGAIQDYQKLLAMNDRDMEVYFQLAMCYSAMEYAELSFYFLTKAVELGLKDFAKIHTLDEFSYLRVQNEFNEFVKNGYKLTNIDPNLERNFQDYKSGVINEDLFVLSTKK